MCARTQIVIQSSEMLWIAVAVSGAELDLYNTGNAVEQVLVSGPAEMFERIEISPAELQQTLSTCRLAEG